MATTVSYGSITLTDVTDISELSIYPKSNLPQSIIYSPDQNSFTPNWSESNLILSPSIWYGGEQLSTTDNLVTITWSRREGIGAVTALTTGETVSDGTMVVSGETIPKGTLVVNQNKFTENSTMITYIVAVSYQEPTLSQALTAQDEITFTMTKQASTVKSATITGETIFKYNGDGTIKGTPTITLNGRVTGSGVNISAWQYQQSNGSWATYPNSTTSPTLTVRESDLVFTNDKCVIRLYTTDEDIYDYHTITKLKDGAAGTDTISAVLTNEDQMIPVSSSGTADYSDATSRIIIYESGEDVTSQWSIAVSYDSNNLTVTTSTTTAANDTVTITNMVGATGTISFTATKTGHDPILKQFSVIKIESGADGKSPTVYSLEPSTLVLNKTIGTTPTFTPSSVRFYAYQIKEQTKSIYKGRFKIYENVLAKDITSSTQAKYTSDSDENSGYHDYTPSASCTSIVCILYESGGTSTKLDTQTITVTTDGQTGKQGDKGDDGTDALNIIVGNSYDGIPVDGDGKTTSAYTILIPFAGYQGTAKVATTVVNPPTLFGIAPTTTNATTSADGSIQYIIPAETSITNDNGVVTFTFKFTEANKTVTYDYSWGKARQGKDGGRWYSGTKITGTSTTATIFADSGITSAVIGDMYLNTSTYNTYRCTVGGNASAAKWIYVNNIKGTTGKGISSITNQYYLSTSDTTQSDGSWSDTPQTYIEGRYYWTRSHIVWDDGGSPTNTTPVLDNALTDANANAIDARKVATNYLSIDNTGIMVANMQDGEQTPSTATGRNVFIDNTSVNIRDRQTVLASFDDNEVQIGKEGNIISHFTDRSMKIGLNNTSFIELGCINGADGRTYMKLVSSTFISELKTDWKISEFHHAEYADGVDATNDITIVDEYHFTVKDRRNVTLYVHYWTNDPTPVFTFGTRVEGGGRGFRSMTIGKNNIASGQDSFAVGENNFIKTTEGDNGIRGIALGGNNTVTARDSQAMGCYCEAKGLFSHAHGCYVIAASSYQTAIGAYNAEDTEGKNLFIIGNGVNTSDRSNALAVDWHGNIYLDMNITNSTTNQNLLTAITNAGWDDDVYDD